MTDSSQKIIYITEKAIKHLLSFNQLNINKMYLKISVKQGGCSGLSYSMNFVDKNNVKDFDETIDYDHFQVICDSKSLLYLYGMSLDYEDVLIGGGFKFINPNAIKTCGCGKSFSI